MDYKINQKEQDAMRGLPHVQQLVYLLGLRPYMDYATGIVGIKRGISYQSIAEALYVEPHSGYRSGSPSRMQIRRAVAGLQRVELIEPVNKQSKKLILKCVLATYDHFIQNKADRKATHQSDPSFHNVKDLTSTGYGSLNLKSNSLIASQTDTPPVSGNIIIFFQQGFDVFWQHYPRKVAKQQAWQAFCTLGLDNALFQTIMQGLQQQIQDYERLQALKRWVPAWKYPANWLLQHCWQDTLITTEEEVIYEKKHRDLLWDSCKKSIL